jgi:hypothetical protein
MASRCYYYVEDNCVKCKAVEIKWDCGFDIEAKHLYIDSILVLIPDKYKPAADFTTASPVWIARSCSPHLLVDENYQKFDRIYGETDVSPELHDFRYFKCLSGDQLQFIDSMNAFVDVFHNPFSKGFHTQAHSLAVLKLLRQQGKFDEMMSDYEKFSKWWTENHEHDEFDTGL